MKIVISGLSGCGATTVSKIVSEKLKVKKINYTFKNLALEKGLAFKEVQENALKNNYDLILDSRILSMAKGDFVLASRLACWLSNYNLSVWLEAGVETRAERIAKREKESFKKILKKTIKRDRQNIERYKRVYGINILDHSFVDLAINTERMNAFQIAELIAEAAEKTILKKNKSVSIIRSKINQKL